MSNLSCILPDAATMGTRMTRIRRIFADLPQLQSVFIRPIRVIRVPIVAALSSIQLALFSVLFPAHVFAQTPADTFRLLQSLPVNAVFAATDKLANVYVITPENAVEKYAPDGRLLTRYTNNRLGRPLRLDVSNPLKVLVWYADFRTAVFLDRSLTALGELNLIAAGYPEVRAVAAAQDGNLWIYDEVNFRLVKITPEGEKRYESQSLNLLDPTPRQPSCLRENNDRLLLADSTQGVFVFDLFAQFDRFFTPLQPVKDFQVVDDQVHYLAGNRIVAEHLRVRANREIVIPETLFAGKTAILSEAGLLLLDGNKVEVYIY